MEKPLSKIDRFSTAELILGVNTLENSGHKFSATTSIFFLRNYTVENIEPYLKYHLYLSDIGVDIKYGGYDNVEQELIGGNIPHSEVLILSLILDNLAPNFRSPDWDFKETGERLENILNLTLKVKSSLLVLNTFIPPVLDIGGVAASSRDNGIRSRISNLNGRIEEFVAKNSGRCVLIDFERIVQIHGHDNAFDYRYWYLSKAPFKKNFLDSYSQCVARIVRALKGKNKKVLVLDCDDTLWGGVIGEDGIDGIKLDRNDPQGRIYYDFQESIVSLSSQGVIVVLCSKNNESDVWEVIDRHPHCLLKRSHIAGWRINWEDKVSNMKSLASELNLGLDSFVFVDNSPIECGLVEKLLPEVTVLLTPNPVHTLPLLLHKDGWFDTITVSEEDLKKTKMYQEESLRNASKSEYTSVEDYLASLGLRITVCLMKPSDIPRVAQLTQKTNQFNLTTIRYREAQIASLANDDRYGIFTLNVSDKFGDSGLTGVAILCRDDKWGVIESLLLSCRVLGRRVEFAFIKSALEQAGRKMGVACWRASYRISKKNGQVSDLWTKLRFKVRSVEGDTTFYECSEKELVFPDVSFIELVT